MLKALVQCACYVLKASLPTNWVHTWSKNPFCKKCCAPLLLMAGIESGDPKEMYCNFYRIFTAIYHNFTAIFSGLGDYPPGWGVELNSTPPPSHPRLKDGFLSQKANMYMPSKVPTGILTQPPPTPLGPKQRLGGPSFKERAGKGSVRGGDQLQTEKTNHGVMPTSPHGCIRTLDNRRRSPPAPNLILRPCPPPPPRLVVGIKTTPKWGIKPPLIPFLAIFHPWGGFIPPFAGVGLSPQRGAFILPFGHWWVFIPHFW